MNKITALRHRLWQAERALYNWPSDKNMDTVFFLKRDIRRAENPSAVVKGPNLATAIWPPKPA